MAKKCLFLSALVLASSFMACSDKKQEQNVEINDSTTPLHLLKPAYKTPYGEVSADSITEALQTIFAYIEEQTPHRVVDSLGQEVTDLTDLPEGAQVEKLAFRLSSYEWGVTYQALLAASEATGDERYRALVEREFRFIEKVTPAFLQRYGTEEHCPDNQMAPILRPRALDDCGAMCTAMMKATMGQETPLTDIIDNYFAFIEHGQYRLSTGDNDFLFARHRPQRNTIWLDDMFMGLPALATRSLYTGDPHYLDEAITMFWSFVRRMWVPEKRIYRHGYVEGLAQQPTYHWARANGWAILTTCELLDALSQDDPRREAILGQLREHIAGLATLQSSEGFWHQLLDRNDSYLETSATAIYCYCIAHAARQGWVEPITYGPVAQLAWHAVRSQITPDGKVHGTCVGTGMAFDPAFYYYRPVSAAAAHGYGPTIWAAAEMLQLLKTWHPRTNDSGLHYYDKPQDNPAPLFYITDDAQGEEVHW